MEVKCFKEVKGPHSGTAPLANLSTISHFQHAGATVECIRSSKSTAVELEIQLTEVVLCLLLVQRCGTALSALSIASGVQEQAQDVLVPPLLRHCLTPNNTFFSQ